MGSIKKSHPPYSVIGGIPAKVLKTRWERVDDILEHERLLYPEEERLSRDILKEVYERKALLSI
jgi:hypothetical protein